LGIDILYSEKIVRWEGIEIPLKPFGTLRNDSEYAEYVYMNATETSILREAEERHQEILDADYEALNIDEYVRKQTHLAQHEQNALRDLLEKFPDLFQGGLGMLNIQPVHLDLKEGAQPFHARAYPIPEAHKEKVKKEIDRLDDIDVLERDDDTEWAAASFAIPKKTGDIRIVTDFRKLNGMLLRKPYPLPKIAEILQTMQGFRYATALDLSMGYYHIPLDEFSQKLCATVFPWGKYKYKRLPMGIKNAPDIFQSIMNRLLGHLGFVKVYLDDVIITSNGT
jgi:hypothetical protein